MTWKRKMIIIWKVYNLFVQKKEKKYLKAKYDQISQKLEYECKKEELMTILISCSKNIIMAEFNSKLVSIGKTQENTNKLKRDTRLLKIFVNMYPLI